MQLIALALSAAAFEALAEANARADQAARLEAAAKPKPKTKPKPTTKMKSPIDAPASDSKNGSSAPAPVSATV